MGINLPGQISLWRATDSSVIHAALWSEGAMQELADPAGYPTSIARSINDRGQVAGWASSSANPVDSRALVRAFVVTRGQMQLLGTLGGRDSRAFGLNAAGQVVGGSSLADGSHHAFMAVGLSMRDLGTLPGGSFSQAFAINSAGDAVGVSDSRRKEKRAVLWRGKQIVDLGTLPGGRVSSARAINSYDQIAGFSDCPEGYHAFLYAKGRMQDLGTLGNDPSAAYGLNDQGEVVGASGVSATRRHAFLWRSGHMMDLNAFIPSDAGWTLIQADAINNRGQIVCVGSHAGMLPHALLLTPNTKRL